MSTLRIDTKHVVKAGPAWNFGDFGDRLSPTLDAACYLNWDSRAGVEKYVSTAFGNPYAVISWDNNAGGRGDLELACFPPGVNYQPNWYPTPWYPDDGAYPYVNDQPAVTTFNSWPEMVATDTTSRESRQQTFYLLVQPWGNYGNQAISTGAWGGDFRFELSTGRFSIGRSGLSKVSERYWFNSGDGTWPLVCVIILDEDRTTLRVNGYTIWDEDTFWGDAPGSMGVVGSYEYDGSSGGASDFQRLVCYEEVHSSAQYESAEEWLMWFYNCKPFLDIIPFTP